MTHINDVVNSIFTMISDLEICFPLKERPESRVSMDVGWEKPPRGWMKINTDGSVKPDLMRATCGGLI